MSAPELLTVGGLFSGIGGLEYGLELTGGFRTAWQCERDEWCRSILAKHWRDVPCYGDVAEVDERAPRVDVVCGGFPCQPVSLAGRGLAQADERWLWPEFARVVRLLRPRYVIVENVPGLLARGMGDVLGDLAASGYDAEWDCIPAAAVGAPHRRDRVWIVAYPGQREALADTDGERRPRLAPVDSSDGGLEVEPRDDAARRGLGSTGRDEGPAQDVADAAGEQRIQQERRRRGRHLLPDAEPGGRDARQVPPGRGERGGTRRVFGRRPGTADAWAAEPELGRVAHGIPHRVDRLRGLGNAVVPQVAEAVGRMILADALELA